MARTWMFATGLAIAAAAWMMPAQTVVGQSSVQQPAPSAARSTSALAGTVTSKAEGAMEGVLVTAQREGTTFTTTVATDARGRYAFPRDRLTNGKYAVTVRVQGFTLVRRESAVVPPQGSATLDLALEAVTDRNMLASQLTTLEWLQSMPGSTEAKDSYFRRSVNCAFCHPLEKAVRTTFTAEQFIPVIRRMATYQADNTSGWGVGRLQRVPGSGTGFMPHEPIAELMAGANLSGGRKTWAYEFKTLPRPKGRATRAIIDVYPIPRQPSVMHDISIDSKGNVWYGNSGWDYIGKFDPRTGKFSEWPIPARKSDVAGVHDVQVDREDNLWMSFGPREGADDVGVMKFDSATERWTVFNNPGEGLTCLHYGYIPQARASLDTMWTGGRLMQDGKSVPAVCRFNIKTGKAEGIPLFTGAPPGSHMPYQLERDSNDVVYALDFGTSWETPNATHYVVRVDPRTKTTNWFPTPSTKAFPRRGAMDSQDRYWFGEYFADKIAFFDTRSETFQEFPIGIKYLAPYFAQPDKQGDIWVSNFTTDRVIRFNPSTKEMTFYLMPEYYDSRKVLVDYSTGTLVVWLGSQNTAHLIRIEPLD